MTNNCCEKCLHTTTEGEPYDYDVYCGDKECNCHTPQPTLSTDWEENAVALILTPLIKQIFHGENRTSENIHKELDKTIERIVSLLSTTRTDERRRILDAIPPKFWDDQDHADGGYISKRELKALLTKDPN